MPQKLSLIPLDSTPYTHFRQFYSIVIFCFISKARLAGTEAVFNKHCWLLRQTILGNCLQQELLSKGKKRRINRYRKDKNQTQHVHWREHTCHNFIAVLKPHKFSYCCLCDQACMTHGLGCASQGWLCDHPHLPAINTLCVLCPTHDFFIFLPCREETSVAILVLDKGMAQLQNWNETRDRQQSMWVGTFYTTTGVA